MSLQGNYNATITITRKTRSGTEDGTPIYSPSVVVVAGWFDAIDVRTMDTPFRDLNVAYVDRRALFLCDAGADIQQDDVGIIAIGGYDQGHHLLAAREAEGIFLPDRVHRPGVDGYRRV